MRVGLIAMLRASEDGTLRGCLPLAGRSVIAWQAALLQSLAVERVLCLTEATTGDIIALQQDLEGQGVQFHALKGQADRGAERGRGRGQQQGPGRGGDEGRGRGHGNGRGNGNGRGG